MRFSAKFIQKSISECHCYMRGGRGGLALVERPEDPSGALSVGKQLLCSEGPPAGVIWGLTGALTDLCAGRRAVDTDIR